MRPTLWPDRSEDLFPSEGCSPPDTAIRGPRLPLFISCHHPPLHADASAYEGANLFIHYHPAEEKDAQDVKKYIADKSPSTKVELYAGDLRTEEESLKLVEAIKKWSGSRLDVL